LLAEIANLLFEPTRFALSILHDANPSQLKQRDYVCRCASRFLQKSGSWFGDDSTASVFSALAKASHLGLLHPIALL
jgi:hypothetical protein